MQLAASQREGELVAAMARVDCDHERNEHTQKQRNEDERHDHCHAVIASGGEVLSHLRLAVGSAKL